MGELNLAPAREAHHMTVSCFQWAMQPHKGPLCGGGGPFLLFLESHKQFRRSWEWICPIFGHAFTQ